MNALHRKLLRDLRRQRMQALAIVATLLLGTMLFGASYDAYRNLDASYARVFTAVRAADLYITGGRTDEIARAVRETDGVAAVVTRIQGEVAARDRR